MLLYVKVDHFSDFQISPHAPSAISEYTIPSPFKKLNSTLIKGGTRKKRKILGKSTFPKLYAEDSCFVCQHKDINEIEEYLNVDYSNIRQNQYCLLLNLKGKTENLT